MELSRLHLVLDKGFYSLNNVDDLLEARDKFIFAVPIQRKWVQRLIDQVWETIQDPDGYRKIDKETLYVHTQLYPWGEKRYRCYVHLYYNAHAAAEVTDSFTEELLAYKEELEKGLLVKEHEEAYKTYFTVKETPVRPGGACRPRELGPGCAWPAAGKAVCPWLVPRKKGQRPIMQAHAIGRAAKPTAQNRLLHKLTLSSVAMRILTFCLACPPLKPKNQIWACCIHNIVFSTR